MEEALNKSLYKFDKTIAKDLFYKNDYPWEVLDKIHDFILSEGEKLNPKIYDKLGKDVWIARSAKIVKSVAITGPCIIGENAELRKSAFIRGDVIIGNNCTVGNSTELKNCILFDNSEVPHFNYVGDSIIGYHVHLSAGVITSNLKIDNKDVNINGKSTHLRKVGSFIGDNVEVGCNTVLNPGTIIKHDSVIYPLLSIRGIIDSNKIVKSMNEIIDKKEPLN